MTLLDSRKEGNRYRLGYIIWRQSQSRLRLEQDDAMRVSSQAIGETSGSTGEQTAQTEG